MKRSAIKPRRKTLRRGEPSSLDKYEARVRCYMRALGICAICGKYAPLEHENEMFRGNLCHKLGKRVHGWRESEVTGQKHFWAHNSCHMKSHNCGGKPCPTKPR